MNPPSIDSLALRLNVGDGYHDYAGQWVSFSPEAKTLILHVMGCSTADDAAVEEECPRLDALRWRTLAPTVVAAHGHRVRVELNISVPSAGDLHWMIRDENGMVRDGRLPVVECPEVCNGHADGSSISRRAFDVPVVLAPGYYTLKVTVAGRTASSSIVVSPDLCYEPPAIVAG